MRAESLLADLQWLQALARELVRDPEVAADAVQDTWVAALRHDGVLVHQRAWLATVLRNCLLLRGRGAARSRERERRAARAEAGAATDELVQRAEQQQQLVGAVLRLPPAHRDVVLLRFFDGMPPRAIAQRLDVPVATVHSRLQRSLQQLRLLLDGSCGGRAAWVMAWQSLSAGSPWAAPVLGVVMQTKVKLAVVAVLAAGTVTFWWPRDGADRAPAPPADAVGAARPRGGHDGVDGGGAADAAGSAAGGARRSVEPMATGAARPAAAPDRVAVTGRVCGCDGQPLAAVPVRARGDDAVAAVTDTAGAFAVELLPRATSLVVEDERWVLVLGAQWAPGSSVQPVLVVAPAVAVGGVVVDAHGGPVARATVSYELPPDFATRFPVALDRAESMRWSAATTPAGRFAFARLPRIEGAQLLAIAEAMRPATVPVPPSDADDLQIRLEPFAFEQGQLDGVVVDPLGAPVAGARVAMGVTSVATDRDGRFGLVLRRAGWPTVITAAKAGYQPGRVELPRGGGARREEWPERLVIRLGPTPLSIVGSVLDEAGAPVADALVWITDPTLLGIAGMLPVQTEYLIAGGEIPRQADRMQVQFADDPTADQMFMTNASEVRQPTAGWYYVVTDEHGHFAVPGLLPRDYRVRAFDPASGVGTEVGPVPAGGATELRITRTGLWAELRGRVVSLRGEPLAGIEVEHHTTMFAANERVPGGRFEGRAIRTLQTVRTGADGAFALRLVSPVHSRFGFDGDAILPRGMRADEVADPAAVVVTVEARCHVEVTLADPAEADAIAAEDASGQEVQLSVLRAGSHQVTSDLELHDGKSGVFVLGERAAALLLRRGGMLVRKVPLQLDPAVTTVVR